MTGMVSPGAMGYLAIMAETKLECRTVRDKAGRGKTKRLLALESFFSLLFFFSSL